MPVNVKESEIKEFIEHYLSSPADAEAVATVTRIIQKGANESNFPKMVVLTFDQGVQRLGVENTIMNCWLTGMYMGIAFDQRRRELEELARVQAKDAPKSLLRDPNEPRKPGCYCKPGQCAAPVVMGRQTPCLDPEKRDAKAE